MGIDGAPRDGPKMNCKLWVEKALPFLEGVLTPPEERAYSAHLIECPICRTEVEGGRVLIRALRRLPEPAMSRVAAAGFDAAVLERIGAAAPAAAAPMATAPARGDRHAAAAAIAARSRLAGRPEFTVHSPLRSLTLASLGLAAVSIATTLLFGEWIVRGLRVSFALAFAALANGGEWFVERMGAKIVEAVTLTRILGRAMGDLGPWAEAVKQLLVVRGPELMIAFVLVTALFGLAALLLRRDRRKARGISNS